MEQLDRSVGHHQQQKHRRRRLRCAPPLEGLANRIKKQLGETLFTCSSFMLRYTDGYFEPRAKQTDWRLGISACYSHFVECNRSAATEMPNPLLGLGKSTHLVYRKFTQTTKTTTTSMAQQAKGLPAA